MKRILCVLMLLVLLFVLSSCSQELPDAPSAVQTAAATVTQAPLLPSNPTAAPPSRVFTDEPPALPYLRIKHYVNGEYVCGFIALTEEEVAQAMHETANVDVADLIQICTAENPQGRYGLMPPLYAELATEYAGFYAQSPADIGEIVSATMTVTQFDESRTQTVAEPKELAQLGVLLRSAKRVQRTNCPWTGVLTLTMADGSTMTIQTATDSCPSMLFGTGFCYQISKSDHAWLWRLFHEVAPE